MSQRLEIDPPLDPGEVAFVAGFAPEPVRSHQGRPVGRGGAVRTWPGQPLVPSPWVPCAEGCCLVLTPGRGSRGAAGQWLRFLVATFLAPTHRVSGTAALGTSPGAAAGLLVVEEGDVFEGYVR